MLDRMKSLLQAKDACVLATAADAQPHCSLMSYVTDEAGDRILMVTSRHSTKFTNLVQNPRVSLLVDTRDGASSGEGGEVQALTVAGRAEIEEDENEDAQARDRLLRGHPHLRPILEDPESVVICIHIDSFLLLDGPAKASFESNPTGTAP